MTFQWTYTAEICHVVDGDTFDFRVDLGFETFKNVRVRLKGVDTAEIYGVEKESDEYKLGMEQTEFVRDWFDNADEVIVETYKDETGKYGRYLADVVNENHDSLRDELIEEWPEAEYEY